MRDPRPLRVLVWWPLERARARWTEALARSELLCGARVEAAPSASAVCALTTDARSRPAEAEESVLVAPLELARGQELAGFSVRAGVATVLLGDPDSLAAASALRAGAQAVVPPPEGGDISELARAVHHAHCRLASLSELTRRLDRLERVALTDALTDTYNRFGIERFLRLEGSRSRRSGLPLHALVLDLDDFKDINDRFGLEGGDRVLAAVARRIVSAVRAQDHVARVGGDEFVVLLPDTRRAEAEVVAERVRRAIATTAAPLAGGREVGATASLSLVEVLPGITSTTALLGEADGALRRSKARGKNRVELAHATEPSAPVAALAPVRPIVSVAEGRVVGAYVARPAAATAPASSLDPLARALETPVPAPLRWLLLECPFDALTALQAAPRARLTPHPAAAQTLLTVSEQGLTGDPSLLSSAARAARDRGFGLALVELGFGRGSLESVLALEPAVVGLGPRLTRGIAASGRAKAQVLGRLLRSLASLRVDVVAFGIPPGVDRDALLSLGVPYFCEPHPRGAAHAPEPAAVATGG